MISAERRRRVSPSTFQCTITIPDVKSYSTKEAEEGEKLKIHIWEFCVVQCTRENNNPTEDKKKCSGDNKINFMKMLLDGLTCTMGGW